MTGYPPKCPQNGSRDLPIGTVQAGDYWPGDTTTDAQGNRWVVNREGGWHFVGPAAKTHVA